MAGEPSCRVRSPRAGPGTDPHAKKGRLRSSAIVSFQKRTFKTLQRRRRSMIAACGCAWVKGNGMERQSGVMWGEDPRRFNSWVGASHMQDTAQIEVESVGS